MPTGFLVILLGLVFATVFLFVYAIGGFIRLARGGDDRAVERRLSSISALGVKAQRPESLLRSQDTSAAWMKSIPFFAALSKLILTSGVAMKPEFALLIMVSLAVVAFVLLFLFLPAILLPLAFPAAFLIAVGSVVFYLRRARKKRHAQFEEQLPDAIDLIIRSLKVGHPFSGAMNAIAKELPVPISAEFATAFQEVSYGQDIPTALVNMTKRIPLADLRYLAMAVQIQQEAGGNLVESLSKLSTVIRERFRLFRKVKALTVEGRFSGWFLSLFPVVLVLGLQAVKPDYFTSVMDFRYFPHLAITTVILLIINVVAMRIVTKIEV